MNLLLGTIVLLPFSFAPQGYAPCNGQLLQIKQYAALFSLLGTQFGGDGYNTFALPNLAAAAPKGLQYVIVMDGPYPTR